MRRSIFICACLTVAGGVAAAPERNGPPPGGPPGGRLFVSPMGEPFRGEVGGVAPAARWFAQADRNGDGQITLTEMILDAARFFRTLDVDGNGEIGPVEIDRYETDILPEVRTGESFQGPGGDGDRAPPGGRGGGMHRGGMGGGMGGAMGGRGGGMGGGGDMDGPPDGGGGRGRSGGGGAPGGEPLRGAARYGYLALPEPVVAADTNMNRAIAPQEFQAAAQRRFALLDTNGDGVLTRGELPDLDRRGGPRRRRAPPRDRMPVDPPPE